MYKHSFTFTLQIPKCYTLDLMDRNHKDREKHENVRSGHKLV